MPTDFSTEYSQRSDDELLHLATQRHYMTAEAVAALDGDYVVVTSPSPTELNIRNLRSGRSGARGGGRRTYGDVGEGSALNGN